MSNRESINNNPQNERDLRLLEAIEADPAISQRNLSNRLGVALGITNTLIKTLVKKGLVKIKGENNRTLTYHLTHTGVLHKSRLAMEWTLNTIGEYGRLRKEISRQLASISKQNVSKVLLYGANELAEIVLTVAPESGLDVVGVADEDTGRESLAGREVRAVKTFTESSYEAIINCANKKVPDAGSKTVFTLFDEHTWA